jgi:hypothetical protein
MYCIYLKNPAGNVGQQLATLTFYLIEGTTCGWNTLVDSYAHLCDLNLKNISEHCNSDPPLKGQIQDK